MAASATGARRATRLHRAFLVGALTATLWGQTPPAEDIRNRETPHTDTHFQPRAYKTLAEWEVRATQLREQILSAAGLLPMPEKTPLRPQVFGRIAYPDYSIEMVLIETLPGYYLGGNLYRPVGREGRRPAVLTPHGHWTYGRLENVPLGSIPARAINMARQGYVVFAYDMVGYNDTVQTPHVFGGPREQLWAFGPLGLQLWNSIRAADFLESLPDVDPGRMAMTGASGGGTQTFLLAAVDPRIQAAAPVNMISAIMQGGSPCENAPNLRVGTYNVEIAALAAPRPLLMVSATGDWTRNTPREEFPAVQAIYQLYGKAAEVETQQVDAPHNYNRESREHVYKFFARKVLGASDASGYEEKGYRVEKLQDMLALHGRSLPPGALTYEQIVEQWIAAAAWQTRTTTGAAQLEERLRIAIGAEWPSRVIHSQQGEAVVLGREGAGDRVPGLWFAGKGEALLAVHPEGAAAARNLDKVKEWRAAGRPVLLIDAFQTGSAVAPRNRDTRYFLTFNRSDDANRAQDIVTAIAWLAQQGHQKPRLTASGKAAVWSMFAAAVAGRPVTLDADLSGFKGEDQDFVEQFFVPGIQRAGGLLAARRVLAAR